MSLSKRRHQLQSRNQQFIMLLLLSKMERHRNQNKNYKSRDYT